MIRNVIPVILIVLTFNAISAQKLTMNLEQNFSYISSAPGISLYVIESDYNQVVFSGPNIDSVLTKVVDDVLTIQVESATSKHLNSVVVYYDKSYVRSKINVHVEEPEKKTFYSIPEAPRLLRF